MAWGRGAGAEGTDAQEVGVLVALHPSSSSGLPSCLCAAVGAATTDCRAAPESSISVLGTILPWH